MELGGALDGPVKTAYTWPDWSWYQSAVPLKKAELSQ